jgi:MFS family permease
VAVRTAEQERAGERAPERRKVSRHRSAEELGPHYKWIALSNTTLGLLMATINSSIVLIALPDIFKGIGINPLAPGNTSYLLWMIMGFLVVTAVLVVGFGRLGDMYGRVRMYNLGFAVFAVSSVLLAVTWMQGDAAALWLIGWRIVQGVGGAFLFANSSAILTDAFPTNQRGMALGINGVAAIAGSFLGLLLGGVLAPVNWHLVFLVSVPFGVFGTVWAYVKLHDTGTRQRSRMDWWGNITFAVGLIAVLVGITYGLQPYGGHAMGWTNPGVLGALGGGVLVLIIFMIIEAKVANPLFHLSLFRIRNFTAANIANLMASLGRGGLQFILILWLQGIWLPLHGYSFEQTPLWAGIYMVPMTVGFLVSSPLSGVLSDRLGGRLFSVGGMIVAAVTFLLLAYLPVDFSYPQFAALLLLNGLGMGLFASPNRADTMNALPANARGAGAGMSATFQNSAMVLSIGIFFSLIVTGLATNLPSALTHGLTAHGVPTADAAQIAQLPPIAVLFAAFLGYNPIQTLLGPVLGQLSPDQASFLTGRSFFPNLIAQPFSDGLKIAFWFAIAACVVAAVASSLCRRLRPVAATAAPDAEPHGAELAGVAGEAGGIPGELVLPPPGRAAQHARVVGNGYGGNGHGGNGAPGITGTARTPAGTPVAGAVVTVTGPDGRQVDRCLVGPQGGYLLTGLRPGGYTAIASAPGYRPEATAVRVSWEAAANVDFVLQGNGVLLGTVRSETDGTAVVGATVLATDAAGQVAARTTTGADGGYRLDGLPEGDVVVTANAPDSRPAARPVTVTLDAPVVVDLLLPAQGAVTGVVSTPGGAPLGGATVTVLDPEGQVVATTTTDDEGGYALRGLDRGEYTLVSSLYQPTAVRVDVTAGQLAEVDVRLGG